jgi:hypothetical protein
LVLLFYPKDPVKIILCHGEDCSMSLREKLNNPWKRLAFLGFSLCGSCVLGFIILAIFHLSFGPERTKWVPVETKSNADRIYYFIDIHCAKEISDAVNGYDPLEPSLSRAPSEEYMAATKSQDPEGLPLKIREECTTRSVPQRVVSYPTLPSFSSFEEMLLGWSVVFLFVFGFFSIWFNITKKFYEATFANIIRWIVKG